MFQLDNIQIAAILRDFLFRVFSFNFRSWQHQKRSNSTIPPSVMKSWVQIWQPCTNAFCDVSTPSVQSAAPATEKWWRVKQRATPVTQNHLNKPEDMLQNATLPKESGPWPPNISDEHVSCTAPATRHASLQILFRCPTPAIAFGNATKTWRFTHFWQGA